MTHRTKLFGSLLALACCLGLTACTGLIFQPSSISYSEPSKMGIETEDVFIAGDAGVLLHGWRLPAQGPTRGSVVFLHGNAENISSHVGGVYWLPRHGFEVFLFDYRGYGRSTGKAEIDGVMRDAQRMIDYAREHKASADRTVTVIGQSLGGSIAIYALSQLPDTTGINGLITISAFSDYRRITRDALAGHWLTGALRWPLSLTISNRYRPLDAIEKLSPIPVFVMHSEADEVVPAYHAQQLFEAAGQPRYQRWLQGTHNQVMALSVNHAVLLEVLESLNRSATATGISRLACEACPLASPAWPGDIPAPGKTR